VAEQTVSVGNSGRQPTANPNHDTVRTGPPGPTDAER
jgi:hypothetical protein